MSKSKKNKNQIKESEVPTTKTQPIEPITEVSTTTVQEEPIEVVYAIEVVEPITEAPRELLVEFKLIPKKPLPGLKQRFHEQKRIEEQKKK